MSGITEGRKKAKIIANDIRSAGTGSEFVYLLLEIPDEGNISAQIWLTKKALPMAKGQLKACGFDYGNESLVILKTNRSHLMGKTLDIDVEEETWKGDTRLKARIVASEVTKKRIESIDSMLKSGDEPEQQEDEDIPF
jgi:hypothetical protein